MKSPEVSIELLIARMRLALDEQPMKTSSKAFCAMSVALALADARMAEIGHGAHATEVEWLALCRDAYRRIRGDETPAPRPGLGRCTICLAGGRLVDAVYVATAASGLEWFECAAHDSADHKEVFGEAGHERVKLDAIEVWFARAARRHRETEGDASIQNKPLDCLGLELPTRNCTICMARWKRRVPAALIATGENGMQWFECASHVKEDHYLTFGEGGELRVSVEPIEQWFARHGLSGSPSAPAK